MTLYARQYPSSAEIDLEPSFNIIFHQLHTYVHNIVLALSGTDSLYFFMLYSYTPLSGFHGVLSGFLVGIKQIMPDEELSLLKIKPKVIFFW